MVMAQNIEKTFKCDDDRSSEIVIKQLVYAMSIIYEGRTSSTVLQRSETWCQEYIESSSNFICGYVDLIVSEICYNSTDNTCHNSPDKNSGNIVHWQTTNVIMIVSGLLVISIFFNIYAIPRKKTTIINNL
ncbi:hypothetical protein RF11_04041 [Thelohanellus kitauei]|uniref:Uncharacterized protein n=1 Tax=Thelohanellus kitauei TaxID=669202 RepID=A0A0C2MVV7_THEKT|nr:hypothetical protein RF11_04041 [Thelohanellus kitauei]